MPEPTEVALVDLLVVFFLVSWYSYRGKRRIVRYLSKQRKEKKGCKLARINRFKGARF